LWAHQSQESARNASGNFFFDGPLIFSYGRHFPIAKHIKYRGRAAVLFTLRTYSNTTANHCSFVRRSIPAGVQVFNVPDPCAKGNEEALASYAERIEEGALKALRARSRKDWLATQLADLVNEANAYAQFFGLKSKFTIPQEESLRQALANEKEARAKERQRKAEYAERVRLANTQHIRDWQSGISNHIPWNLPDTYLRKEGEEIVTSHGARVPLEHALKLLALLRSGADYRHNGHTFHVGEFKLDSIAGDTVTIGCHAIQRTEIERLAIELGY
jgi:hypothetical protein